MGNIFFRLARLLVHGTCVSTAWGQNPQINPLLPAGGSWSNCNLYTGDIHFHCIPILIAYAVEFLFAIIGTFALIQIMIAGYEIAAGPLLNSSESGKNRLRNAILGFVFSLLVFAIINFVISSMTS